MAYEEKYMKKAIALAKKAFDLDEVPIGAVIVRGDEILATAYNRREKTNDATAHAEILAIKKACKKIGDFRLLDADIYVTLEPCVMCMGAIINARLNNVYFGAYISNGSISASELADRAELNHKTNVLGGYLKDECSSMISSYFKSKRVKKSDKSNA